MRSEKRWSTKGLHRAVKDRVRQLAEEGKEHMVKLVSKPARPKTSRTPVGSPPRMRTGRLRRSIKMRVWSTPGQSGRVIATIDPTATRGGEHYPYILEGPSPFSFFGVPKGPYPFIRRTFRWMKKRAPKVLGKPFERAVWSSLTGIDRKEIRKMYV